MPACYECSAPFTIPAGAVLSTLVCSQCGERPCTWCRDCGGWFAELELERCEECRAGALRLAERERRDAMEESRGDWLRDEGKDRRAW